MDKYEYSAEESCPRIDIFLSEKLDKTRSAVKKLIDGGNVKINGKTCKPSQEVMAGDKVEVIVP
ncbi:MAG: RNA pseudouridine synthase, partial [Clostridia bacterium]|nr:RNA pseudouridine synthase [Clostridia bacterium]